MKKLVLCILFLAAGGACFFLGWVQREVPPGSFGVLRSKTHGTDRGVIQEGEFRWAWYKLIPGNASVGVFTPQGAAVPVQASGILPSADTYAALAGVKTDFSYELDGTVFCSLKGQSLPALAEKYNMAGQSDLDVWQKRAVEEIRSFTLRRLWDYVEQEAAMEEARKTGTLLGLERDLAAAFPDWENWKLTLKTIRTPDMALYREVKELYTQYRAAQKDAMDQELSKSAVRGAAVRARFEELSLYGELLTKYPVLLDYLALEKSFQESTD
jgi:hypothetical protein